MNLKALLPLPVLCVNLAACGGGTPTLDDFLPPVPAPDGTAQSVWAGPITSTNTVELISGPAQTGLVGDFFIRNSKARFVIQAATRSIGVLPYGGTVIDAVPLDAQGGDLAEDHLGEVGMLYMAGRTCAHDTIEVLLDGSGGGPAMIRARGRSAINDFINLKGMAVVILSIPDAIDPDIEDSVECATTYILDPDANNLQVAWTLFNPAPDAVEGPLLSFADTGGEVSTFAPSLGYFNVSLDDVSTLLGDRSSNYSVIQGPDVAYGTLPRIDDPAATPVAAVSLLGISIQIIKATNLFDIMDPDFWFLNLAQNEGVTQWMDLVVGRDAGDIDAFFQARTAVPTGVSGTVTLVPSGDPAPFARVGVYTDDNTNGILDDTDSVVTFFDADDLGNYGGALAAGDYLFEADIIDVGRTGTLSVTVGASAVVVPALEMPDMVRVDYEIRDANGNLIPAKITVVGNNPVPLNTRIHHALDRSFGIVNIAQSAHGTTTGVPSDPSLWLPAGGPYRLFVARGPEWSLASQQIMPAPGDTLNLTFQLVRVVDTSGYVATEFHQHSLGSPDSIIPFEERLRSLVTEGIEFFASTDHDFLVDYDPFIDSLGLRDWIDAVVGVESTPFAWGHFIGFPLNIDDTDPNRGAVDWATGAATGFDMLPGELFADLRARGGQIVQANHPRTASGLTSFQNYFDRTGLTFDFANKAIFGDPTKGPVPASWIRQPEDMDLFSADFDALEVWNGLGIGDSDGDGIRENTSLDRVLRDWMNFLSFGKVTAPLGNSDTHTNRKDPAGMPRTLVRVSDDSASAIAAGIDADVYATLLGTAPMDLIVTNGPMLSVSADGGATSALGQVVTPVGPAVILSIVANSPQWITFDTIEVFANNTFDPITTADPTAITPLICYTTRDINAMDPADPCLLAPLAPMPMTVVLQAAGGGESRWTAIVTTSIDVADVNTRTGATGTDAWMAVRVRGQRAIFPVFAAGAITALNIDAIVAAADDAALEAALGDSGVPAAAITSAIFVDFDGGGYVAPFAQ